MDTPSYPGGTAGKLGDSYEVTWAVLSLLDLLSGEATTVYLEPRGPEGLGIEFTVTGSDGTSVVHSVKRPGASAWSVSDLVRGEGRSVLGDLFQRMDSDRTRGVLVAMAPTTDELSKRSRRCDTVEDLLADLELSEGLGKEFKRLINGLTRSAADVHAHLRDLEVNTIGHNLLVRSVEERVPSLLRQDDGAAADPEGTRLALQEFVIKSLGSGVSKHDLLAEVRRLHLAEQDLQANMAITRLLEDRNAAHAAYIDRTLVNDSPIPRVQADAIFKMLTSSTTSVVITGNAGHGKSCLVEQVLARCRNDEVPHLVLSAEEFTTTLSAHELGVRVGLPASPAIVLPALARSAPSVLCVDQLDAVSFINGGDVQGWHVVEELLEQASRIPGMRLLLACRSFDLDHDPRLRSLVTGASRVAARVEVDPLTPEEVRQALATADRDPGAISTPELELLRTPLHLYLFLQIAPTRFASRRELFDAFWALKELRVDSRCGRGAWIASMKAIAESMSSRGALSVNASVLDVIGGGVKEILASEGVLHDGPGGITFFHASFLDYVFARVSTREQTDLVVLTTDVGDAG